MSRLLDLPSIDLEDLVADTELLTRVDRKYVVERGEIERIIEQLDERTRVLWIGERWAFGYESVYFDTPDLLSYHATAYGRRRRFKVRTRAYLDSGSAYLEVKTSDGRGTTVKDRIDYPLGERERLTVAGRAHLESRLGATVLAGRRTETLDATLVTRYRRVTLVPPGGDHRVTIDTALSWEDATGARLALPELAIVETKSGTRPSGMDHLLWRSGHRPVAISKYGTGLAALRRDLPDNKWARVLRRHVIPSKELS